MRKVKNNMQLRWVLRGGLIGGKKKILQIRAWGRGRWTPWEDVPIEKEEPPVDERQAKLFYRGDDVKS
jgi:hypothetical protein